MMSNIILNGLTKNEFKELITHCVSKAIGVKSSIKIPKQDSEEKFLTRIEVSKMLSVTLPTLHEYTKQGILTSYSIGKRVLYKYDEVSKALHERTFSRCRKGGTNA